MYVIIFIHKHEDNFIYNINIFTISFSYYRRLAARGYSSSSQKVNTRTEDSTISSKCYYIYTKYKKGKRFLHESILSYILTGTYVTPTFVVLAFDALSLSIYDTECVNF